MKGNANDTALSEKEKWQVVIDGLTAIVGGVDRAIEEIETAGIAIVIGTVIANAGDAREGKCCLFSSIF